MTMFILHINTHTNEKDTHPIMFSRNDAKL